MLKVVLPNTMEYKAYMFLFSNVAGWMTRIWGKFSVCFIYICFALIHSQDAQLHLKYLWMIEQRI